MNLKKITGIFVVFTLFSLNICFATTGIVDTPAARIREKADAESNIITKAYEDDEVEILDESGDWYKVKFEGKTGFVSKSLIKVKKDKNDTTNTTNTNTTNTASTDATTTSENQGEPVQSTATVGSKCIVSKNTSLRVLPNFASNELKELTKKSEVQVEKEINYWVKVSTSEGISGWVLKNSISESGEIVEDKEEETKPEEKKTEENTNTAVENKVEENTTVENKAKENTTVENKAEENKTVENTAVNNTTSNETTSSSSKKGKVIVETANVREKASKTADIIDCLDEDDEVTILEETGDWYKIKTSKISSGYVAKSLIKVTSDNVSSRSLPEPRAEESTANGDAVVEYAKQFLGSSYVYGGKSPETGFDCSGFTSYIFKNFGYSLASVAASQESAGTPVERENLKPGDLILFYDDAKTKIGHTGIYIGNNEFIHAANPQRGVVIDNMQTLSYYNERFVSARRIVE